MSWPKSSDSTLTRQPSSQEMCAKKTLAVVLRNAIDIEPEQAPVMIEMLKTYLATFDNIGGEFTRMEDYMPFRIANCGYW